MTKAVTPTGSLLPAIPQDTLFVCLQGTESASLESALKDL